MSFSEQDENTSFRNNDWTHERQRIIEKIANFLQMKNIFIGDFWQSNRNYASSEDINLFCELSGLKLSAQDLINLKSQIFFEKEVISIYEFCDIIPQWRQSSADNVGQFLKKRSQKLMQNLQQKNKTNKLLRIKSHINVHSRPMSVNNNKRLNSASGDNLNNHKQSRVYRPNNSKKYLETHVKKNKKKQAELAETIERTKNQYEYSMLIKMNQMNQINRKNKSPITYRAYKNAEGNIKVRIFDMEIMKKQITLKQFESQYKIFMKSIKQNKQWQQPSLSSSKKKNPDSDYQSRMNSGGIAMKKNQKKNQRQKQLKNLLENTVKLTQLLQEQIKIFKGRGIYGAQNYNE